MTTIGTASLGCFRAPRRCNAEKNRLRKIMIVPLASVDDIFEEHYGGQQIKYVTDTSVILNDALDIGKRVLFEGAQGVMLDIDQGISFTSSKPCRWWCDNWVWCWSK